MNSSITKVFIVTAPDQKRFQPSGENHSNLRKGAFSSMETDQVPPHLNFSLADLPGEIWKPIQGWETLYEISNKGRVKSLSKRYPVPDGSFRMGETKIHKLDIGKHIGKEYARAKLNLNNGSKKFSVHRLVAIHFIPNPENKPQVNYLDGNKLNNCVENLEWATPHENVKHAYQTGLILDPLKHLGEVRIGTKHGMALLSEKDVYAIRKRWDTGERESTIIKDYPQVTKSALRSVGKRKNWKHLPEL